MTERDSPAHEYYTPLPDNQPREEEVVAALRVLRDRGPVALSPAELRVLFKWRHACRAWAAIDIEGGYPSEAVILADGTVVRVTEPVKDHDHLEVTTLAAFVADEMEDDHLWDVAADLWPDEFGDLGDPEDPGMIGGPPGLDAACEIMVREGPKGRARVREIADRNAGKLGRW